MFHNVMVKPNSRVNAQKIARVFGGVPFGSAEIPNPLRATSVGGIFTSLLDLFIFAGFIACGIFIVYGGIMMLTSFGSDDKLRKAKGILTWAVIGFLILLFAKAIEITIRRFIGA